jgi:integrase
MPRLIQSVPKYQKHRASGQAVVTINSRDYYLGPHGTKASKLEYDRLVSEWLSSGRSSSFGAPERGYTVVEMVADYIRHSAAFHGTDPRGEYGKIVRCMRSLRELYGRTAADEFGVLQLKAIRQTIARPDLSRGYVNETMRRIVAAFKWAAAEGKLPASVPMNLAIVPGLRKGKCNLREPEPVGAVDDDIVDATLAHLPEVVADMVKLQRLTGMRPAEVCILRPGDLDCTGEVWIYRPRKHKTQHHGRNRVVLIGPLAQAILLPYLARESATNCFRPADSELNRRATRHAARVTPLSCGNRPGSVKTPRSKRRAGESYPTASYRRAIHRACDKAEVTRWAPNQLRHAAATEVRREFGLEAAQIVLGHSKADVTQVYAERDLAKGLEVAKRIG